MKKWLCVLLAVLLLLSMTACKKKSAEKTENTKSTQSTQQKPTENDTSISFGTVDVNLQTIADKTAFTQPIVCIYGEGTVTVNAPRFTGIPMTAVYYSQNYRFGEGRAVVKVATQTGGQDLLIDQQGRIIGDYTPVMKEDQSVRPADIGADYFAGEERYVYTDGALCGIKDASGKVIAEPRYAQAHINFYDGYAVAQKTDGTYVVLDTDGKEYGTVPGGRSNGSGTVIVLTGEPGAYAQKLYDIHGNCISGSYDSISYFYNGLALIAKDQKIGIIDNKGVVVLEPTIAFDTVTYSPDGRGFSVVFMEGDAFLLPIGGELAVIAIQRQSGTDPYQPKDISDRYYPVLNSKQTFALRDDKELLLKDYIFPEVRKPIRKCGDVKIAQFNLESKKAVAISCSTATLVLLEDEGKIYASEYTFRGMDHLNNNGTFDWNHTDGEGLHYGTSKLIFKDGKITEVELCRVDDDQKGNIKYTLAGKEVTKAQYDTQVTAGFGSPVSWQPMGEYPNGPIW